VGLKSLKSLNLTNGYPNKNKNKNNKVKSKPLELARKKSKQDYIFKKKMRLKKHLNPRFWDCKQKHF
jgi:hypothetical protein